MGRRTVITVLLLVAAGVAIAIGHPRGSRASGAQTGTRTSSSRALSLPAGDKSAPGDTRPVRAPTGVTPRARRRTPKPPRDPDDIDGHDGPPSPSTEGVKPAGATAERAVRAYATLFTNWKAAELNGRARELEAMSTGEARTIARALAGRETMLERYRVKNTGDVVAIARGRGAETGKWAVVVDEDTSGYGPYLGLPSTSELIWATVRRTRKGFVVSTWYPVN